MKRTLWNDGWLFWEEKDSFALLWEAPSTAKPVTLPHDAMLLKEANPQSPNGGNTGYRDGGNYCYEKVFSPATDTERQYALYFEGVYAYASVYVNGQLAGYHPYGYTGFVVDVSSFLQYGEENEIRVCVKNAAKNSRWYSGSGIYRDVWLLEASSPVHLHPGSFRIYTIGLEGQHRAILHLSATVEHKETKNKETKNGEAFLRFLVGSKKKDVPLQLEKGVPGAATTIQLDNPRLWSAETPELYEGKAQLWVNGILVDSEETTFGVRTLELDATHGLRVNGQEIKLRGACVHHDSGILGAATFYDNEYRRIHILKEAGFNAVRTAHNPAAPSLLRACDELGMYVMEEAFDTWTRSKVDYDYAISFCDWWQRDLEAMVRDAFNHPSVILYSLGNEIPEIGLDAGAALCGELSETLKRLDPTRFITAGINGVFMVGDVVGRVAGDVMQQLGEGNPQIQGNVNEFLTLMDTHLDQLVNHEEITNRLNKVCLSLDVAGYNYMTGRYERDVQERPDRVIVGSETYPPEIARNWGIITCYPQLIGDFTWTGWDYLGEAGGGVPAYAFGEGGLGAQYPCQISYVGDIDITGFRRPTSYYREIVFGLRKDPYIAVENPYRYGQKRIPSPWVLSDTVSGWNYPGREGKPVRVEVYAPGDTVELLLNGTSLGKQPSGAAKGFRTIFETVYVPGELEAVCYQNGKELGRVSLRTPQGKARLSATVESGKTGELTYISLEAKDSEGVLDVQGNMEIQVAVKGKGEIYFGSGNPKPSTNFLQGKTQLWNGRALLILRKLHRDSSLQVTLKADGGQLELLL